MDHQGYEVSKERDALQFDEPRDLPPLILDEHLDSLRFEHTQLFHFLQRHVEI